MPTPDEAVAMIRAGLGGRMSHYTFDYGEAVGPSMRGYEGMKACTSRLGPCTFFSDGKCELHGTLKPSEGRLAHHDRDWREVHVYVMKSWDQRSLRRVLKEREAHGNH